MAPVQNVELDIDNLLGKLDTLNGKLDAMRLAMENGIHVSGLSGIADSLTTIAGAMTLFGGSFHGGLLTLAYADESPVTAALESLASTLGITNVKLVAIDSKIGEAANRVAPEGHTLTGHLDDKLTGISQDITALASHVAPSGDNLASHLHDDLIVVATQLTAVADRLCPEGETLVDTMAEQGGEVRDAITSVADRICPEDETLVDTIAEQGGEVITAVEELAGRIAPDGNNLHEDLEGAFGILSNDLDGIKGALAPEEGNIAATLALTNLEIHNLKLADDANQFTKIESAITGLKTSIHADIPAAATALAAKLAPADKTIWEIGNRIAPDTKDIYTLFGARLKQLRSVLAWVGLKDVTYDGQQEEITAATAWAGQLTDIKENIGDLLLQDSQLTLIDGEGNIAQYNHKGP